MTFDLVVRSGTVVTADGPKPIDIGVSGGVTVQDIYDFLSAWNNASDGTCF